jgi:hypothetical protein
MHRETEPEKADNPPQGTGRYPLVDRLAGLHMDHNRRAFRMRAPLDLVRHARDRQEHRYRQPAERTGRRGEIQLAMAWRARRLRSS